MFVQMPSWHMFPVSHSSMSAGHRGVSGDQAVWSQASVTVFPLPYGAFILPTHKNHAWVSMPTVPRIPWPYLMLKSSCLPTLHPHSPNKRYPLLLDWLEFFSFSSGTLKAQPPSTNATMPLLESPDALSSTPPSLALVPRGSARHSSIQLCLLG